MFLFAVNYGAMVEANAKKLRIILICARTYFAIMDEILMEVRADNFSFSLLTSCARLAARPRSSRAIQKRRK